MWMRVHSNNHQMAFPGPTSGKAARKADLCYCNMDITPRFHEATITQIVDANGISLCEPSRPARVFDGHVVQLQPYACRSALANGCRRNLHA